VEPTIAFSHTVDDVTIAWSSVGNGPTLVHLPGVPFSNFEAEWRSPVLRRTFERLARDLRFIQYDGRGTGRSQRDVTDLSLDAMLRDIDAVVDAAGLERFALLGFFHSVTGAIAYAARHPDRVSHLVLFGGSARGWNPMSGAGTQALLSLIERDWDTFVESATHAWLGWPAGDEGRLAADWFRTATTPAIARATMEAASVIDVSGEVDAVRCPVLVLHRRDAQVIPLEMSEQLAAGFAHGQLRILEGSSASLFYENADEIVADIVEFVTSGDRARRGTPGPLSTGPAGRRAADLSPRELEVLRLVAAGDSNGEIAGRLGITINTVERHVANVYRKIDARGRADATAFAIRNGLA
jgi:pimeloyl-ACP methyl ester carboxylesterase/DNA-binding CsgD family transcriptional regulator